MPENARSLLVTSGISQTVDEARLCPEHASEAYKANPTIQLTDPRVYEGVKSVGGDQGNAAKAAQFTGGSSSGQNTDVAPALTPPADN